MHRTLRNDDGFTIIELLVVILIIGILAAIALPSFLGQSQKAHDADAKSNARSLVSHIEACNATENNYGSCQATNLTDTGLVLGNGSGEVTSAVESDGFIVTAKSHTGSSFSIKRSSSTAGYQRICSGNSAGCRSGSW